MTSNRSFFNGRLLRETIKRNLWAIILSFIGFFFCLPLPLAIVVQGLSDGGGFAVRQDLLETAQNNAYSLLSYVNPAVKLGMCIMAVLCGVALFSYLHSRRRVDFYHALPASRTALFVNNYLTGILTVVPAYLVMYALSLVMAGALGVGGLLSAGMVCKTLLVNLVFFLLLYTISVLATILTGNTILAAALDAWILFSLPVLSLVLEVLCIQYFDTWSDSFMLNWLLENGSPVILYFFTGTSGFSGNYTSFNYPIVPQMLVLAVLWLALTALALVLFRIRKSERAGVAIAFEGFKPPLKWYMVLVIALLFGSVFLGIGGEFWIWFGLLAGTVLGHLFIEIIYHFDLRAAFAHWKTMIVLAVAAVAIVFGIQRDVLGYDEWLPDEDSIEAIGFSGTYPWQVVDEYGYADTYFYNGTGCGSGLEKGGLTDPAVVHTLYSIAQECVEQQKAGTPQQAGPEDETGWFNVQYRLSNGTYASRSYTYVGADTIPALLDEVRFSEEYIRQEGTAYQVNLDQELTQQTLRLSVRTNAAPSDTTSAVVSDAAQASEIIRTLQEESVSLTPQVAANSTPVLRIDARFDYVDQWDGQTLEEIVQFIPVYATYTRTLALLEQYGNVVPQELTVDDLRGITVSWVDAPPVSGGVYHADGSPLDQSEQASATETASYDADEVESGSVTVTDPAMMQALLQNAVIEPAAQSCDISRRLISDGVYSVEAVFQNNYSVMLYYPEGQFPVELCQSARTSALT